MKIDHNGNWKERSIQMTVDITRPEIEVLIEERLQTGLFGDAEDVIFHALKLMPVPARIAAADTPEEAWDEAI
jgi:hypothetical protein